MNDCLYIVIPCYNEEEVLPETAKRLFEKLTSLINNKKVSKQSRIVFVNDGSKDKTWDLICNLHNSNKIFSGINLSKNRGHQNALLAGLMTVKELCDITISLDADLQDDINAIDDMIEKYKSGCEIVYGVRSSRSTDTYFKRFTADCFYRLMNAIGVQTVFNHADFRLMSKRALNSLAEFKEVNLFLRGIVPLIGYKSDTVSYERSKRFAGKSKYKLTKMLSFAVDGITSLSISPIRFITIMGAIIFLISVIILIWNAISLLMGQIVGDLFLILSSIWTIGGLILLSIGVIGEYIGKIYFETKKRPRYIVDKFINSTDETL